MFRSIKYSGTSKLLVHFNHHIKEKTSYYHVSRACFDQHVLPREYVALVKHKQTRKRTGNNAEKRLKNSQILLKKEYLYGISPCLSALEANRRIFYGVFINFDAENMKTRPQFEKIKALAEKRRIPIKAVSKTRLDNVSGNRPHQNIVLKVGNLNRIPLQETFFGNLPATSSHNRPPFWLVLEGIQDPMNLGAILRTSAYLGADKIVSSESDSCSLTPAVSKASAGAMETLPLYSANVHQLLKEKRKASWQILGAVQSHVHYPKPTPCNNYRLDKPSILVVGNEGRGLSKGTQELCTKFLTITSNMKSRVGDLDSLNVSVATGILLHSLLASID